MKLLYIVMFYSIVNAQYRSKTLNHSASFSVVQGQGMFRGTNVCLTQSPASGQWRATTAPQVSEKHDNCSKK